MEQLLKTATVLVSNGNQSILAGSAPARSFTGASRCNAVDAVIRFIAPVTVCQLLRSEESIQAFGTVVAVSSARTSLMCSPPLLRCLPAMWMTYSDPSSLPTLMLCLSLRMRCTRNEV